MNRRLLETAQGKRPAERVFRDAEVLNVFTGEWRREDVAVSDSVIVGVGRYNGEEVVDCRGKALVPGFIDAHLHGNPPCSRRRLWRRRCCCFRHNGSDRRPA